MTNQDVKHDDIEIIMLSVFGDESSDKTKSRVFVVAGLLADAGQWAELRRKWKARLGDIIFHAADCESGYGDFKEMKRCDCLELHRDLTQILAESGIIGFGAAIDLAECREIATAVFAEFPDMPYYDCFSRVIKFLSDMAELFIPPDQVEFTFDQNKETQYNAGLLYSWLSEYLPVAGEKISFGTRREPGIQAADLWAREVMKRCDSLKFNDRVDPRPQWKCLASTQRFKCKFMRGAEFAHDIEESRNSKTIDEAGYQRWTTSNRLVDNLSNRFRYHAMMDSAKKRATP